MIALFRETFKLSNAILVNSIIYRLRKLPLLKYIVPGKLYGNDAVNMVVIIMSCILKIGSKLATQAFCFLFICFLAKLFNEHLSQNMLVIFIAFTCTFSVVTNSTLQASKDKYYAIQLMRIDGNQYGIMDFTMNALVNVIRCFLVVLVLSIIMGFPIYYSIAFPLFLLSMKTISTIGWLTYYKTHREMQINKTAFLLPVYILGIILAAAGTYFQIYMSDMIFIIITMVCLMISYFAYAAIQKTTLFSPYYKKRLTLNMVVFNADEASQIAKKRITKQISYDVHVNSKKKGYELFNELFVQRHKKILMNSALRISVIYSLFLISAITLLYFIPEARKDTALYIQNHLPIFLMIMYFTNRGAKVTMAMFVNCDSSMLTYRFYRQPKSLLRLFTQRLKTMMKVNLVPSFVVSLGLVITLFVCDQQIEPIVYILVFIVINAMSAFFSVHNLILYYLLQPYNINLQAKGYLYNIITSITYIVCYRMVNIQLNLYLFTISVILFCILYILISLFLVYRMAPRTFKLKN